MNSAGQTICLAMIVKNEAPVIRRCLDSVRPIIDHWIIVDTGSTDGTQDIIRAHFKDVPGTLHERPWQDFAHNRSEALSLAREHGTYTFIIDADDALEVPTDFQMPVLTDDSYYVDIHFGGMRYQRPQLISNAIAWRYAGVLHEFLTCEDAKTIGHLPLIMHINQDGARRRDPTTYQRDAATLENALKVETDPFLISRYTFYLAQSYRDFGDKRQSIELYLKRATLGFWHEEVYISLYAAAQLMQELDYPQSDVVAAYNRAIDAMPSRAEAIHGLTRYLRFQGKNQEGYEAGKRGLDLTAPPNGLFVDLWIYQYGLLDEYAINAYWSGHYSDCLAASLKALASGALPASETQRVIANAQYASEHLPKGPNLGDVGTESLVAQHDPGPPRMLRTRCDAAPRVLVAILAKQKEPCLPLYLDCIEALDYPKSSIVLYIRTNNNTDATEQILRDWVARVGHLYAGVEFDAQDVEARVERFGVHEWNPTRFRVLGHIRNVSLQRAVAQNCAFYFVCDVDNFIRPNTLRELVALNLPIVAPLLRSVNPHDPYSNYHAEIDANGYFRDCDQYQWILNRWVRGVMELPVVHCTYLIRADIIDELTYLDNSDRYEYVIFSDSARKAGIPQYIDNRQVYGYISFGEGDDHYVDGGVEQARGLLFKQRKSAPSRADSGEQSLTVPRTERQRAHRTTNGKRAIRLKEFPPFAELINRPDDSYIAERDGSLVQSNYVMNTDGDGFIRSSNRTSPDGKQIIVLGDSVVESMYADPDQRFCAQLEKILRADYDADVAVLNGGYSGATTLHMFNVFLNKIVPIKPVAVILMIGIVDVDVASLRASYWNNDCWLEPLVDLDTFNQSRDVDTVPTANFDDRRKLLQLWSDAARLFEIDLWFATIPHRQAFEGDYVRKAFKDEGEFRRQVALRRTMNEVTRRAARDDGRRLLDLEAELAERSDIFYDMFHLNPAGGEAVARAMLKCGIGSVLQPKLTHMHRRDGTGVQASALVPQDQAEPHPLEALHVINLDRSAERMERFKACNSHLGEIIRVAAVDGNLVDREHLIAQGMITADLPYANGTLGCALSHIQLWKTAAEQNRALTIFEDDVRALPSFPAETRRLISEISGDWDIVFWGYNYDSLYIWIDLGFANAEMRFYEQKLIADHDVIDSLQSPSNIYRLRHSFGLQSYTISPKGARALLNYCLPLDGRLIEFPGTGNVCDNTGIDTLMCGAYPDLKAYIAIPPLALHEDLGSSDRINRD